MAKKVSLGTNVCLYPMPVTLVGALVEGKPNYMTVAWTNRVNLNPPIMAVAVGKSKHTHQGILECGTFSINLPGAGLVEKVDYCGIRSGKDTDKSRLFSTFFGELDTAPLIEECPLNIACRVIQTCDLPGDTLFLGEVVESYLDETCFYEGKPDPEAIDPLVLTMPDNHYWRMGNFIAKAWSVGKEVEKA